MGFEMCMPGACREGGEGVWIAWIVVVVDFFDFFLQCIEERNCKYELMSSSNMDGKKRQALCLAVGGFECRAWLFRVLSHRAEIWGWMAEK
jgi:hypothetical protein